MKDFITNTKNKLRSMIPFRKVNPHVYWNSLLYIFSFVIILLILFSLYMLYQIKNQQILQIAPTTTESTILVNEKLLNKVNETFNNNLTKEKEILNDANSYKDPSIN